MLARDQASALCRNDGLRADELFCRLRCGGGEHELCACFLIECAHVSANELADVGRQRPVGVSVDEARAREALRDLECVERVAGADAVQPDHRGAGEVNVEPLLEQAVERSDRERREAKPFVEGNQSVAGASTTSSTTRVVESTAMPGYVARRPRTRAREQTADRATAGRRRQRRLAARAPVT